MRVASGWVAGKRAWNLRHWTCIASFWEHWKFLFCWRCRRTSPYWFNTRWLHKVTNRSQNLQTRPPSNSVTLTVTGSFNFLIQEIQLWELVFCHASLADDFLSNIKKLMSALLPQNSFIFIFRGNYSVWCIRTLQTIKAGQKWANISPFTGLKASDADL